MSRLRDKGAPIVCITVLIFMFFGSMFGMFEDCSSLTSLNVSKFDTSKVTNMYAMLANTTSLTTLDVSSFDTSQVTSMNSMFRGCKIASLDLSSFDTRNAIDVKWMFRECYSLRKIKTPLSLVR